MPLEIDGTITAIVLAVSLISFFVPVISNFIKLARKRRRPNTVSVGDLLGDKADDMDDD